MSIATSMQVRTLRQAFAGKLARLERLCPDTHLSIVRRYEDVLDRVGWSDEDGAGLNADLQDAFEGLLD